MGYRSRNVLSNLVMYFIILSTAATLYKAGKTDVNSAAEAAQALRPLAGNAGAAYDLCQAVGWRHSLHARPKEAPRFYAAIVVFSLVAMSMNFLGFNPHEGAGLGRNRSRI